MAKATINAEVIALLISGDAQSRHSEKFELSKDVSTVKSLLNAEVPVDEPTGDGRTPLDLAPDLATKEILQKFSRSTTKPEL